MQTTVPARPDVDLAPPKQRHWGRTILGVVLVIIAFDVAKDLADGVGDVSTNGDRNAAAAKAAPLMTDVTDELNAAQTAVNRGDIVVTAAHLNNAGDLMDEAAGYFDGGVDTTLYGYMHSAAEHFHNAADDALLQHFTAAAAEMDAATTALNEAEAYVRSQT